MNVLPSSDRPGSGTDISTALGFLISGIEVRVFAPPDILAILETTLANVPRHGSDRAEVEVRAELRDTMWIVSGNPGERSMMLPAGTIAPSVAGTIVSMILQSISNDDMRVVRAVVLERQGEGVALVGDDWESAMTISAHLCIRGWQYVSGDYALIDRRTLRATGFEKSLHVTSSSLAMLPLAYRRAVESSPWYVTSHGIAFYAVDPSIAAGRNVWSRGAKLLAAIIVDGAIADFPSLEIVPPSKISAPLSGLSQAQNGFEVVLVTLGTYIETCDLVENWLATLSS